MARKATKWIELFHDFIIPLRIYSKEVHSTEEGGSKLVLWESQKRFLDELAHGLDDGVRDFCCLKSRQLGITTISLVIDVFWHAMYPGTRGALVTDTEQNRDENRQIIDGYIKSFPQGYFGSSFTVVKSNRSFMQFSNGSQLSFLSAGTKKKGLSWAEGKGYSFAHLTEVAKYGDPDALKSFEESLAQTNPDRLFIRESTAHGYNHFRNQWLSYKNDNLTKRAFFIGWWASNVNRIEKTDRRFGVYGLHPASGEERERVKAVRQNYDFVIKPEHLAWIRWKESDQTQQEQILQQNQPWTEQDAFVQTGYSFFQSRILNLDIKAMDTAMADGDTEYLYQGYRYELGNDFWAIKLERLTGENERPRIELKIWEEPVATGKYVIGFDPAYGRNEHKDRHAISVWRCYADKMIQVAEYATHDVEVKHAAWCLAHLAGAYRDCVVNVEISGPGRMVMMEWDHLRDQLKAEQYSRVVEEREWDEALDNARWYLYHRADSTGTGGAYNFETTWRTKFELMHQFRGAYATRELRIRSKFLLKEMMIVVQDGTEIAAPESSGDHCKDDRVFAAALAVRAWINWVRPGQIANNETYDRISQEESGEITVGAKSMNSIVYRFFQRKAEEAENQPEERGPQWKVARGLI